MDDEALACGGLISLLPGKERIHIIYATDGMKSPAPIIPGVDSISPDLGETRIMESIEAMGYLGVPEGNLRFLRLPEARLNQHIRELTTQLLELIEAINPSFIFIPFRFDRHPDHLVINRVLSKAHKLGRIQARLIEYFVYYRWKLLPKKDIRAYIKPESLMKVDISEVSEKKRMALDRFKSQTTLYYPWQTRPILTPVLLDEESNNPEYFLEHDSSVPGTAVFSKATLWIKFTHRLEPFLKKWKYLAGAYLKRAAQSYAHHAD